MEFLQHSQLQPDKASYKIYNINHYCFHKHFNLISDFVKISYAFLKWHKWEVIADSFIRDMI